MKSQAGIAILLAVVAYGLSDALLAWFFEFLHALFELVEFALDELVEHIFHTDRQTTQMIVFYMIVLVVGVSVYMLLRLLPDWCGTIKSNLAASGRRLKGEFLDRWQATTVLNKMKWWGLLTVGAGVVLMGLFS